MPGFWLRDIEECARFEFVQISSLITPVSAGLWDILGQDNAESMAARPGGLDESLHGDHVGSIVGTDVALCYGPHFRMSCSRQCHILEMSGAQDGKNGLR